MSYLAQSQLAVDPSLLARIAACAATEGIVSPQTWAYSWQWQLSAQPGWASKYSSAQAAHRANPDEVPPPGENEDGITDSDILTAVQYLNGGMD